MEEGIPFRFELLGGSGHCCGIGDFEFHARLRRGVDRPATSLVPKQACAAWASGQTPKCLEPPIFSLWK